MKAQKTCQTCLAVCLMTLAKEAGVNIPESEELSILIEGLKFTKLDFSTGHVEYVCQKYGLKLEQVVEFPAFYKQLAKLTLPLTMRLTCAKIDKRLLEKNIQTGLAIIYIDKYALEGIFHWPHFVILQSMHAGTATILDPWDGKQYKYPVKALIRAVQSLRNKLKISPLLVRLR